MKKGKVGVKLSRQKSARKALARSLARSLILTGKIRTTKTKAKFAQRFAEKLVTLAKKKTLSANRGIFSELHDKVATKKLISEIAPKFANVNSGFTRIINLGARIGDAAPVVFLEFTYSDTVAVAEKPKAAIEPVTEEKKELTKTQEREARKRVRDKKEAKGDEKSKK